MEISAYVLTCNSQRYIERVLTQLDKFADEIVVVDSGSSDDTLSIVERYSKAVVYHRQFDNFRDQRNFAANSCKHDNVFFVDSDEIVDDALVEELLRIKQNTEELGRTAYAVLRNWYVMEQPVHCIYPVVSPDKVVRLFDRRHVSYAEGSNYVHETPSGHERMILIERGCIEHHTFHDKAEFKRKAEQYTWLAAKDLLYRHHKRPTLLRIIFNPVSAFIKWYISKGGCRDGKVGLYCAAYAYRYTKLKYVNGRKIRRMEREGQLPESERL